jgi:hypothetical protein
VSGYPRNSQIAATAAKITTTLGVNTTRPLYIEEHFYEDIIMRVTEKKLQANRQLTRTLKTHAHLQRTHKSESANEKKKAPPKNDETNPNSR